MSKTNKTKTAVTAEPGALTVLPPDSAIQLPAYIAADFQQAKLYWDMSRMGAAMMVVGYILMGVELIRLHKVHGIRPGRKKAADSNSRNHSVISWPDIVMAVFGKSDDWARLAMMTGEIGKQRIEILRSADLENTPFAKLTAERQEEVVKTVQKAVPAQTVLQLTQDWGITKKSSAGKGGGDGRTPGSTDDRTPTQIALETIWPVQNLLGTVGSDANFESMLLRLPAHRPERDADNLANLADLHDQLTKWLSATEDAIQQHKHHAHGRKRA